jgi:hypothetical protein
MAFDVNYVAVLVAAVVSIVLGMLWYSPALFGKQWMKLVGLTQKDMNKMKKKGMTGSYVGMIISSLVLAYVLAVFIGIAGTTGIAGGLQIGFWLWLGFQATVTLGNVLWAGGPFKLWVLNNSFNLLSVLVQGAIIATWAF